LVQETHGNAPLLERRCAQIGEVRRCDMGW